MRNNERLAIYFCLDTLLDTRLGTLAKISDDIAFQALMGGEYMVRWSDDPTTYMDGVSFEQYREKWLSRDVDTLKRSFPTDHALDAQLIINDLEDRHGAGDPTVPHLPTVIINYYPYNLSSAEVKEHIKVFRAMFKCRSDVQMIRRATEDLTLEWFKDGAFAAAYIYDYKAWMEAVITAPINRGEQIVPCPDIVFYLPTLIHDGSAKDVYAECERALGRVPDSFAANKLYCAQYIGIDWVDPIYYSISPSILFPNEKLKETPEQPDLPVEEALLYDKSNPEHVERIGRMLKDEP